MYHFLFHTCIGLPHEMLIFGDILINMKTENRRKKTTLTHSPLSRPEPPVRIHFVSTACDVISFNGQG